ncbi:MAG: hypothetical protein AABM42_01670 [Actinomycetota bacterium]
MSVTVLVVVVAVVVVVVGVVVGVVDVVVGAVDVLVVGVTVAVVVSLSPLSAAITASATTRPITTATSSAIAHLTPRLMPPGGDWPGGGPGDGSGWPM